MADLEEVVGIYGSPKLYPDLPRSVAGLHQHFADPDRIDTDGFFRQVEAEVRFVKGKHRGSVRTRRHASRLTPKLTWVSRLEHPRADGCKLW
jgi:hypothetical protein